MQSKPTRRVRAFPQSWRLMPLALLVNAVVVSPGGAQTSGATAAESRALEFDRQSDAEKQLGQPCLSMLNSALNAESAMNEMIAARRADTPEFAAKSQERSDQIEKFNQCIRDAHLNAVPPRSTAKQKIIGKPAWTAQTATDRNYRFADGTVATFPLLDQGDRLDTSVPPRLLRKDSMVVATAQYRRYDGTTRSIPGTLVP